MSRRFMRGSLAATGLFFALWLTLLLAGAASADQSRIHGETGTPPQFQQDNVNVFLPVQRNISDAAAPFCRLGVNGHIDGFDLKPFRIGWYQDYEADRRAKPPAGVEYSPVIRLSPDATTAKGYRYSIKTNWGQTTQAELFRAIDALPGAFWHIGNEPDRPDRLRGGQDAVRPELYARAYHDLYYLIKERDSTAQIVAGNIVQPTPLRLQYLDMVLRAYGRDYKEAMPVDIWGIHNFVLNEASCPFYGDLGVCWGAEIPPGVDATDGLRITIPQIGSFDLFVQQIIRFREWMAERGYRGLPVHLSEYGILVGPPERSGFAEFPFPVVNEYMNRTFDYLLTQTDNDLGDPNDGYRLIQRFSWYSVSDVFFGGYLFEPLDSAPSQFKRSPAGENFVAYAAKLKDEIDFTPTQITFDPIAPLQANGSTTVTVSARIGNAGNTSSNRSVTVRFYNGDPSRNRQIGEDQHVSLAGCGDSAMAQVEWANVAPNNYRVFVVVDPQDSVVETREDNNRTSQSFFFAQGQLFVPITRNALP